MQYPENYYSLDQSSQLYWFLAETGAISTAGAPWTPRSSCSSYHGSSSNSGSICYNMESRSQHVVSHVTRTQEDHHKALMALKNHKEAEKRRRERINSHLDKLRTLVPCNSKIDKASLLAKVVQRVRELKQQTSEITGLEAFPSESDEVTVLSGEYSSDGQLTFMASLCCEDRSDLLPDLIEILNSLHLKTLKAEMVTLGGRIRNIVVVSADKDHSVESVPFLQNALKSLLERSNSNSDRTKRRRVLDHNLFA